MNELAKPTPEASEPEPPSLAAAAALIGDPVRAAILLHLTDGSRRPASELAFLAGASPQAASAHLARLVDGGLLTVENQGRHRFFSIASGEVAEMIEGLANWPTGSRSAAVLIRRCARRASATITSPDSSA
jgi:DNA-binding transcriptional ArsR family regulator